MSESEKLVVDGELVFSALRSHQDTLKKREYYGKHLITNNKERHSEYAEEAIQPVTYPGPSHLTPCRSKQLIFRRETVPSSIAMGSNSTVPLATSRAFSFRSVIECNSGPLTLGENMFIECTLLKNNVLLLRETLLNSNIEVSTLQTLVEDINKAKDAINKKISVQLNEILKELHEQIVRKSFSNDRASNLEHTNTLSSLLPFTPTAMHPYPPPFYFHQFKQFDRPPVVVPESSFSPYSTQSAH
jgi:signal recognition particle GTPase